MSTLHAPALAHMHPPCCWAGRLCQSVTPGAGLPGSPHPRPTTTHPQCCPGCRCPLPLLLRCRQSHPPLQLLPPWPTGRRRPRAGAAPRPRPPTPPPAPPPPATFAGMQRAAQPPPATPAPPRAGDADVAASALAGRQLPPPLSGPSQPRGPSARRSRGCCGCHQGRCPAAGPTPSDSCPLRCGWHGRRCLQGWRGRGRVGGCARRGEGGGAG
jgi:hypothetical protein